MNGEPQKQMPRYECHNKVWALRIKAVQAPTLPRADGDGAILVVGEGFTPIPVDAEYVSKHNPTAGGYYVVYKDGYKSFSPAKAFEDGYTRT